MDFVVKLVSMFVVGIFGQVSPPKRTVTMQKKKSKLIPTTFQYIFFLLAFMTLIAGSANVHSPSDVDSLGYEASVSWILLSSVSLWLRNILSWHQTCSSISFCLSTLFTVSSYTQFEPKGDIIRAADIDHKEKIEDIGAEQGEVGAVKGSALLSVSAK